MSVLRNVPRLVFIPRREPTPSVSLPANPAVPMLDVFAYAEDCILSGRIELTADRLTDVLNAHDQYGLVDVLVESISDGHVIERPEILVGRDELLLVQIVGPRGNPERRSRTRPHPLELQVGPYHLRGHLHALPGSDPIASLRHRQPMVPFTDAVVEHSAEDGLTRRHLSAVLVNQKRIDWVMPIEGDVVTMPDVPFAAPTGPLTKDFTGDIRASDGDAEHDVVDRSLSADKA
jgi:hypothetical protein